MEDILEIGSITLFVNGHIDKKGWLPHEDAVVLSKTLEKELRTRLAQSHKSNYVKITSVTWKQGCVLETITFGLVTTFIYKGIKGYPSFRKGLIAICKDIKYIFLKVDKKETKHKVAIYKIQLLTEEEIIKAFEDTKYNDNE